MSDVLEPAYTYIYLVTSSRWYLEIDHGRNIYTIEISTKPIISLFPHLKSWFNSLPLVGTIHK